MNEKNNQPKFEIISSAEIASAVALSDSFLPTTTSPVVGPDNSLHSQRSYEWTISHSLHRTVMRDSSDDGTDRLIGISVETNANEGMIQSTVYQLVVNNGRFLVTREIENIEDVKTSESELNGHQLNDAEQMQYELGLLTPQADDWSNFIRLLEEGKKSSAPIKTVSALGRLATFFRKNKS